ncbi:MAG: CoA ester lyase [Campylobacterales bacterium]|nr:CoA ester lyase [Campylobacterales bacterium]
MMVSAHNQKHLDKLGVLKCDWAIVNLEDGVNDKALARKMLFDNFHQTKLQFANLKTVVRVNPLDDVGIEDIAIANQLAPNAIRVAKIKSQEDVRKALQLIHKDIEVHLSVETKEAFEQLSKLKIDSRVTTVYLGILDLFESLGLPQNLITLDNPTVNYILSKFLIDSKIAGFYPVGLTFQDYKDTQTFQKWCDKLKTMGYTATSAISPTQVEIINETFSTNKEQIDKAFYIKEVFEKMQSKGISGFSDEKYGFIDEPIYKDALLVLKYFN